MKDLWKKSVVAFGILALILLAMPGMAEEEEDDEWDIDMDYIAPFEFKALNGCQDVWQMVEASGDTHWHIQIKFERDEDDNKTGKYDVKIHANHQGGKGIGYDLVMGEDGRGVPGDDDGWTYFKDGDGNYIETGYQIPGTYNYWFHGTNNVQQHTVYMCILISEGDDGNVIFHLNSHFKLDVETEEWELTNINAWLKCAGAQDKNGAIDCDENPDLCEIFDPLDWF